MKKFKEISVKILNRVAVPLAIICVMLISTWFATYIITSSKAYYRLQFKKNNTENNLEWVYEDLEGTRVYKSYDREDLEKIMNQIVDYLTNKEDSMQVIDDEGMEVFSNQALNHMAAVKKIYNGYSVLTIFLIPLLVFLIIYIDIHFEEIRKRVKKQVIITFSVIAALLLILAVAMLIDSTYAFEQFHHILFPKREDFLDAFFGRKSRYEEKYYINNLLLVEILTEDIFIDAAWIIMATLVLFTSLYVFLVLRRAKETKINQK